MTVDARGYSCPMPVVMVQKAVKADAPATRFAENSGYKVAVAPEGQDFRLSLSK